MQRIHTVIGFVSALVVFSSPVGMPAAFGGSDPTLLDLYYAAEVALIVKRPAVESSATNEKEPIAETVQVLRDKTKSHTPGGQFRGPVNEPSTNHRIPLTPDKLVLVFGNKADNVAYHELSGRKYCQSGRPDYYAGIRWEVQADGMTPPAIEFVVRSPDPTIAVEKRLEYFAKFLEGADRFVAVEAFSEINNAIVAAKYRPIATLRPEQIRGWMLNPKTPTYRRSGYGVMLGMCGGPDDAAVLERIIARPEKDDEDWLWMEGVMSGYLLLNGESGLKFLESTVLADPKASDGEIYTVFSAIRIVRHLGNSRIASERLNTTVKSMLDRPAFTDVIIIDLASAKDWSLQKQLFERFGTADFSDRYIKKAIIGYLIASTKDVPKNASEKLPRHVSDGEKYLEELRRTDPKLVAEVEKFFYLR